MSGILSSGLVHDLIHNYGLWFLFLIVMLESVGVPMPGETVLISAALYAGSTHELNIVAVITVAASAAILGDNFGYLIGRRLGLRLLGRYGHLIHLDHKRLKIGQYLFLQHGGKIVFFGRFVAFLRAFAAVLAGANRMAWPHFLLMNALGGICWASLFGLGAYVFGKEIHLVAGPIGIILLAAAIVLLVAGTVYLRRHEQDLAARAEQAFPGTIADR